jgi:hypothetical protein
VSKLRNWSRVGTLACLFALSGCASLLGPRTVEVSQAQLQQWIDRQFPLNNRLLELFDLHLATPRLTLRPDTDRILTEFEMDVGDRVFKAAHHGTLALEYGVRFEPADNTLRVKQVRVDRFEIDGVPAPMQRQLERLGLQLVEHALEDRAIYTLRPKDIEAIQGHGYRPGEIHVTANGIAVTLVPLAAS